MPSFDRPCVLVGREVGNDLRLDHEQVSRRHAYLQVVNGRVYCVDLASRTGVWWGDRRCAAGWLDGGARVGPFLIRPADSPGEEVHWDPLETPAADLPELPRAVLEVVTPSGQSARVPVNRVLTLIGRASDCRFRLQDASVSRHHAGLLLTESGLWVVDLLSRGGTQLNGERIRWSRLGQGDRLSVGRVLLRAWYDAPVREACPVPNGGPPLAAPVYQLQPAAFVPPVAAPAFPLQSPVSSVAAFVPPSLPPHSGADGPDASALVSLLLQQFGLMQQQMMEQFQQGMQMLVQAFGSLHREQTTILREELAQVNRLTRELNALQAVLQQESAGGSGTPAAVPTLAVGPVPRDEPAPAPDPGPVPDSHAAASTAPDRPPLPARTPTPSTGAGEDPHLVLARRIAALQQERAGRWQKILGFVLGR